MAISSDEVRHIAHLARIGLTEEEVERFRGELSSILAHCEALAAIDTDGVPPTAQSFDLANVERPDVAEPSAPREAVLRNAPRPHDTPGEDGYFRVRAVLE